MNQKHIAWLVTGIVWLVIGISEVNSQSLANQEFWHLTPDDGLSQSTVATIFQDSEGFMWFGTLEGLNKYEGQNQNLVVYKHDPTDSTSLGNDEVEHIYEDSQNNLWIGTDGGGLNLFDRDSETFKAYIAADTPHTGHLSDHTAHKIFEDSQNNLWIGTYNGLNLMDRETETFENFFSDPDDPTTLSDNYITAIFEDHQGNLWIGTTNGLNRLNRDTKTFQRYYLTKRYDSGNNNYVATVYEDSKRRLWIGTQVGLFLFDQENEKFFSPGSQIIDDKVITSASISTINEDSQGVLWIGTENEGLYATSLNNETKQSHRFTASEFYGLNNNSIYSIYESRDNILWIGTFDGGLNILNRRQNKFQHYLNIPGKANSLNENSVFSLLKSQDGDLLIGTDGGGLNKLDEENNQFSAIRHNPENEQGLPSDVILDIEEDSKNRIWLGTYNGGLTRYNIEENTFKTYKFDNDDSTSLRNNQVFAVYEDSEGYIWAGSNGGGVDKLIDEEAGTFQHFDAASVTAGLPDNYIRTIHETIDGNFWFGTYGGGVIKYNPDTNMRWGYNTRNNKLLSNRVLSIHEASDSTLWAGTKGGGIARYNPELDSFESYTTEDGLPNDIINGILEDDHGNLWLSTNNGLSRFSPKTETFRNFTQSDGVQSREFKPGAAYKGEDGFMYFGGINGFNKFHPDSIKENMEVSPIAFTDFQLFNKSVSIGKDSPLKKHINQANEIVLSYTASIITIKYSVLNFNPQQGHTYAYMLEGFDNDWNHVGDQNTATYTNLDPGEYIFKAKTANSDGIWGDQIKQVGLIITPPFWQTTWFYVIAGLLTIGVIFGGFSYRTRQITEHNKLLEQKVADRTTELRESNQELKQALQDLKETRQELVENAHKAGMADIATGVLHNIGNVLNSIITSASITGEVLKKTKWEKFFQANQLLREHQNNLEHFLTSDPRGKKLIDYYLKLEEAIREELKVLRSHNHRMDEKAAMINNVISAQQNFATVGLQGKRANLETVLDDALTIFSASMERHSITVEKNIEPTDEVYFQKTKIVHVLLNLFKNSKEAMNDLTVEERKIVIHLYQQAKEVILEISDSGPGIKAKHLEKVFNHGFTTKKDGHGFGLHSSANYMTEMGAKINARNKEDGSGAVFILKFKVEDKESGIE